MTKRNWFLICIAITLAGAYAFYFTNWFTPDAIHITSHNARNARAVRAPRPSNPGLLARLVANFNADPDADSTTIPITFKLGRPRKLTELKVVVLDEWQTNKNVLPLWHLVADTNSTPISLPFNYGQNIHGMKPEVPGARAQALKPGVKYRMFVTDGSAKGEHDFQATAKPAPASP
jgi:hypothetical protein